MFARSTSLCIEVLCRCRRAFGVPRWVRRAYLASLIVLVLAGGILRVAPVADDPLHPDECLYASWALDIVEGGDHWLSNEVIDKPPLVPYLLAGWVYLVGRGPVALRLMGAMSALLGLCCLCLVLVRLFGRAAALPGLALAALSPVSVALDASALTDPPGVALAVGSVAAAAAGLPLLAGALAGLAVSAKPQMLSYLPLVIAVLAQTLTSKRSWVRMAVGLACVAAGTVAWEIIRQAPLSFVEAALRNYGRTAGPVRAEWCQLTEWLRLLRWIWGDARAAIICGVALLVAILLTSSVRRSRDGAGLAGAGAALSALLYLAGNLAIQAPAWDRYALALVPLFAVLLAWSVHRIGCAVPNGGLWAGASVTFLLGLTMAGPAQEAARSTLPIGDTSPWQGIAAMADYVRGQVPGRATIVYSDLGWHLRYYMYDFPQDFRWFRSDEELVDIVRHARPSFIVARAGVNSESQVQTLVSAGMSVRTVYAAYDHRGCPTMFLMRIMPGN